MKKILLLLAISFAIAFIISSFIFPKLVVAQDQFPEGFCFEGDVKCLVERYTRVYGVLEQKRDILAVMKCESGFNALAVGDKNTSFGLSQIHLPAHPEVTKGQAFDPSFAVEFMVKGFAEHKQSMWTCYSKLQSKQ